MKLPKVVTKSKKRIGRGRGTGKGGHTVGRGQKGQSSRGKIGILFEGVKMKKSLLKRLPLARGKGKFHPKKSRRGKLAAFKISKSSKAAKKLVGTSK
jgi:ribosomal protein L15